VRRWRNLLARRGMFWGVPPRPAAAQARLIAAFIQQADRRLAVPRRGRLWGLPQPPPPPAPGPLVARVARHPGRRLIVPRRGQFFPQAAAPSPALALPQMRQAGRRWLPPRRPAAGFAVPAAAASVPPGTARRASRLARPPAGGSSRCPRRLRLPERRGRWFPRTCASAAPSRSAYPAATAPSRRGRALPRRPGGDSGPVPAAATGQGTAAAPGLHLGRPARVPGIPPQLRRRPSRGPRSPAAGASSRFPRRARRAPHPGR